jgi:hypothetical protein
LIDEWNGKEKPVNFFIHHASEEASSGGIGMLMILMYSKYVRKNQK